MDPRPAAPAGPQTGQPVRPAQRVSRRWRLPQRRSAALSGLLILGLVLALTAWQAEGAALPHTPSRPAALTAAGRTDTLAAPAMAREAQTGTSAGAAGQRAAAPAGGAQSAWGRKIIRTGSLNLTVAGVESALAAVRDTVVQANGIVFSTNSQYQDGNLIATITVQVPVDAFDTAMSRLRKLGTKVTSETSSSQDVGEEYTDLTAQQKNLQVQEEQLRTFMSRATTLADTLQVETQLSQVQGQIEQIQGRLTYLGRQTAMSTITINLTPVAADTPATAAAPGWQPGETAARAWTASLALLTGASDALITVLVFGWWLVPLAALGLLATRKRRPRAGATS